MKTEAVRKNPLTSKSSNTEIEHQIKLWLRRAPDRKGGRNERAKKAAARRKRIKQVRHSVVDDDDVDKVITTMVIRPLDDPT